MSLKSKHSLLVIILLLTACRQEVFFHHTAPIAMERWDRQDTIAFEIPPAPQDGVYDLSFEARVLNDFAYRNMWIVVEQDFQNPEVHTSDTLFVLLTDTLGNLVGDGLTLKQYRTKVSSTQFRKGQSGTIRLHHIMQDVELGRISDVGIYITTPRSE